MPDSLVDDNDTILKGIDKFIGFNRYTLFLCLAFELVILSQAGNVIYLIFAAASPNLIGCGTTIFNETLSQYEACEQFETMNRLENQSCAPILEYQFRSVAVEWNYFCSKTVKVKNSISFQMFGIMVGGIIFGQLSDLYGRKKVCTEFIPFQTVLVCLLMTILLGLLCALAKDLLMFVIIRSVIGIFIGGNAVVMYVYVIEKIPANYRMKVNTFVTWSPNFVILSLVAYLTGSWHTLTIVMNLLAAPSFVCVLFLYESPRWLMQKGRLDEAKETLIAMNDWGQSIKKREKCFSEEEVMNALGFDLKASCELLRQKHYYFHHLFYSWTFLRYNIILAFSCFANSVAFYAMLFNLEKISGSLYVNTAFLGAFRYALGIILATVDHAFTFVGRKFMHTIAIIIFVISAAIILILIKTDLALEFNGFIRAITLIGTGSISLLFIVNAITCAELFPTAIRNLAGANIGTWSRIGNIVAPQLFYLDEFDPSLPYLVIIVMFVVDGVTFLFCLPETKSRPLVEQMPSKEEFILRSCKTTRTLSLRIDDDIEDSCLKSNKSTDMR
ncbi:unnamed protein product [Thelazia callipaeda]|uniref:MFS domain-containing protein n=1 Tax=Thelazia callipaeda TaxID=103827 RepID=A0A0N5D2E0_THECL|nr:unnamed protein product [Thelazia callipaeda]